MGRFQKEKGYHTGGYLAMSNATKEFFSQSCLAQRAQSQSKHDSISAALGITLVKILLHFIFCEEVLVSSQ
jgi:hypothetical protein